MFQLLATAAFGAIVCSAGLVQQSVAQQSQPAPPPDAPTPKQQEAEPHPSANPVTTGVTTGVDMFLTLQKKSLVFPDLAMDGDRLAPGTNSNWRPTIQFRCRRLVRS